MEHFQQVLIMLLDVEVSLKIEEVLVPRDEDY